MKSHLIALSAMLLYAALALGMDVGTTVAFLSHL
jgi:hypothetical protein